MERNLARGRGENRGQFAGEKKGKIATSSRWQEINGRGQGGGDTTRHQAELAQPASEEVRVTYRPHMTERQGRRGLPVSPREREGARARMWLLGWLGRFKQWVVQGKKFYFSKLFSFLNPVLFLNSFLGEMNTYLNI
jgi:hypothetical protein